MEDNAHEIVVILDVKLISEAAFDFSQETEQIETLIYIEEEDYEEKWLSL